jgi:gamma-glutamylcyclotransferase (GGCT)/AIG2-like uncharacterized protein YtfP
MHKVFVYGTLRPGLTEPVMVPGQMFDLGWFPGVVGVEVDDQHFFKAEIVEVDDDGLKRLDQLEGYRASDPDGSFYRRIRYQDGFIYQYNGDVSSKFPVPTGDWLEYTQKERGSNADILTWR